MHRMRIILKICLLCFLSIVLYGCGYEPEYFPKEELVDYKSPVLFLSSRENSEKYFIMLDQPDNKIDLDYDEIWDYDSTRQTFLFSMREEGKDRICEYDLKSGSYQCIFDESDVGQFLEQPDENQFKSLFYHFSECQISGMYGGDIFIYDMKDRKIIYKKKLPEGDNGVICAWIDPQTYLYRPFFEIFEVCLNTGEMKKLESDLGFGWILSEDKTIGCSYGVEEMRWSPILVWDTSDYQIKRFKEGIVTNARLQNYIRSVSIIQEKILKILTINLGEL